MRNGLIASCVSAFSLAASTLPAYATNLVTNGSFEDGLPPSSCSVNGTTTLSGWTVSAGNIDIESTLCGGLDPAADGAYFLDLTGSFGGGAGTISQNIPTTIAESYDLTFHFGANEGGAQPSPPYPNDSNIKSMDVLLNGVLVGHFSQDTTGRADGNSGWTFESIPFTATSSTTQVTFESLNGANGTVYGPYLDAVSVTVPEPAALGLMALGLAGLGCIRREKVTHR